MKKKVQGNLYRLETAHGTALRAEGDPRRMQSGGTGGGGVPLEEYRKDIPPGWEPGLMSYPLKLYLERLKVWYRLFEGADEQVGPLVAGRLRGRAQTIALYLRLPDPLGNIDVGDAALVRLSVDEVRDPSSGQIIQAAIPSGVQALLNALRQAFGDAEQLQATKALEQFFELRRGRTTLQEWSVDWQLKYEEAVTHAGLEINNVAKTYLYFKASGLPQKTIDDILLQVHGDMRRFEEARTLMLRLAHRSFDQSNAPTLHYGEAVEHETDYENSWSNVSDYWAEDWMDANAYYENPWTYDGWHDQSWNEEDWFQQDNYYDREEEGWFEAGWQEEEAPHEEERADDKENAEEYYKGKGKHRASTMGLGCSICGSKWHNTHSCPMQNSGKSGFGGQSSYGPPRKGFNKGKSKGKGKSYGKKGKGWSFAPRKGFGKKGYWMDDGYGGVQQAAYNLRQGHRGGLVLPEPSTPGAEQKVQNKVVPDSPDKSELLRPRSTKSVEAEGPQPEQTVVKKQLNFPEKEAADNFHQVRGRRVLGLLVDPGASSGLIGTDTLKEIMESGALPKSRIEEIEWGPSTTTVTGISGQSDDTLARISLPIDVGSSEVPASYTADLIGGQGSTCPALLPNTSLRQMRAAVMTEWFDNGDGALVVSANGKKLNDPSSELLVMRMLLSESGHYILPVDRQDQWIEESEKKDILSMWRRRRSQDAATALEQTCHQESKLEFVVQEENEKEENKKNITAVVEEDEMPNILVVDSFDYKYDESEKKDYEGDVFPGHLQEGKLKYLKKMYRAVPEMFYTKTRTTPVTPRNARSWARARRGSKPHFWEWCSGSGKLSLLCLLSGLSVMFPVDYRYGWDLGCREHQQLLLEVGHTVGEPRVKFYSPSCRPWSISSTRRDLEITNKERKAEKPTIDYIKKDILRRKEEGHKFLLEQPWSSALWEHLRDLPADIHRTDQCRLGAHDELENPILKPTGLQSDLQLRACVQRCKGHLGKRHGWLQGQTGGNNRTTLAAVYPDQMCRAIAKDIKKYIQGDLLLHARMQGGDHKSFYTCPKCVQGRAATADVEHSFVPGECRHGVWPVGESPQEKKQAKQHNDMMEEFKNRALSNPKVLECKLAAPVNFVFSSEETLVLKWSLMTLLQETMMKFQELESDKIEHNYTHWLQDATTKAWLSRVFKEHMAVRGVLASVQPWSKPMSTPHLTVDQAPLRILISGSIRQWTLSEVEDLREMSAGQSYCPIELEDDWLIAVFGADPGSSEPASSSSSRRQKEKKDAEEIGIAEDLEEIKEVDDEVAAEEVTEKEVKAGSIKPMYDFRRVFKKLPIMAQTDEEKAKRLILGLHERLWHAPYLDLKNILIRCGMPYEVWKLTSDVVASCPICRKYSRAHRRPQHRGAALSSQFNDVVQIDLFRFQEEWYLLTIDEATRYKIATRCEGRELSNIMDALMRSWIRYFGPMRVLVSDQERSMMSVDAGSELQRLGITRQPGGTTTKHQGKQHTATGLVEKHVDLTKITMAKIQSEAERWGLEITGETLAAEASQAQNTVINIGGYTPSMCVFGILPKGFLDPEEEDIVDPKEAPESALDKACRLRQIALSAVQAAIMESRIARANKSRPQRTPVEEIQVGTTQVEIFRDDGGGHGWRGPATVLKIDDDAGTCVVDFQNKPYLMPLRHVRTFRSSFHNFHFGSKQVALTTSITTQKEKDLWQSLQQEVESCSPFKPHTLGRLLKTDDKGQHFIDIPKDGSAKADEILQAAKTYILIHYESLNISGIRYGRGLRAVPVPRYSRGVLVMWTSKSPSLAFVEHNSDTSLRLKNYVNQEIEDVCFIYFYGYVQVGNEEETTSVPISRQVPPSNDSMDTSSTTIKMMEDQEEVDNETKRKGPETRTVVIAPERKKQRTYLQSQELLHLRSIWWMMQRPRNIILKACHIWYEEESRWMQRHRMTSSATSNLLLHLHCRVPAWLNICLLSSTIFRVDEDTDVLTEEQAVKHWAEFEKADFEELKQFHEQKVFVKVKIDEQPSDVVFVDATWVRKFKRNAPGSSKPFKAKSRLCARGFLDPQKSELPTRSTTATRLSQRIIVSTAATHDFEVASWDVAGAFLKGFSFDKVRQILQKKGIQRPRRRVVVIPPPNVRRHLVKLDDSFAVTEEEFGHYGLECLKPAYGLNDAPLAWQLCLHETLRQSGGQQSSLDDCFWWWKDRCGALQAVLTTHVDDIAVAGTKDFMDKTYKMLCDRFGKVALQEMPFTHCGCRYSRVPQGLKIDQQEFVTAMKTQVIEDTKNQDRLLTKEETTKFRSVLGGLLWITATRLDLVSEVGVLQSRVTKATVQDMTNANNLVKKAQQPRYAEVGIVYKKFSNKVKWKLAAIHDASAASKGRAYSQEGVVILLMPDLLDLDPQIHTVNGNVMAEERFGGVAHILSAHGARSKRVSYSTSHSETLAAMSGLETASLVALRLSEIFSKQLKPTLQELAALQEKGIPYLPIDAYTDCRDFYSLTTGGSALPQDRSQRVYILAHREARLAGRLRWMILIPTQCMLADALTKPMLAVQLLKLMTSGQVDFENQPNHPIEARRLPVIDNITEEDLEKGDKGHMEEKEEVRKAQHFVEPQAAHSYSMSGRRLAPWIFFMVVFSSLSAGRTEDEMCKEPETDKLLGATSTSWIILVLLSLCGGLMYKFKKLYERLHWWQDEQLKILLRCQQQEQQLSMLRGDQKIGRLRDILPHLDDLVLTAPGDLRGIADALGTVQQQIMRHGDRMDSIYRELGAVSHDTQQQSNLHSMLHDYVDELRTDLETMNEEFAVLRQLTQRSQLELQRLRDLPTGGATSSTTPLTRPMARIHNGNSDNEPEEEITPAGDSSMADGEGEVYSMDGERIQRYRDAPMGECSDPELWMRIHHGADEAESDISSEGEALNDAVDRVRTAVSEEGPTLSEVEIAERTTARMVKQIRDIRRAIRNMEQDTYMGNLPLHRILELYEMVAPEIPFPMTVDDEGFEAREDPVQGMVYDYIDSLDQRWTFNWWSDAMGFRNDIWFTEHTQREVLDLHTKKEMAIRYDAVIMPDS